MTPGNKKRRGPDRVRVPRQGEMWRIVAGLSMLIAVGMVYQHEFWQHIFKTLHPEGPPISGRQNGLNLQSDDDEINSWFIPYPTYYINLNRSIERRRVFEYIFYDHVPVLRRISAVEAQNHAIRSMYLPDDSTFYAEHVRVSSDSDIPLGKISETELGCILSHLEAIRTAYNDGCHAALIMEDDASSLLTPYWTYTPADAIREAEATNPVWTVIQVGWTWHQVLPVREVLDSRVYNLTRRLFPVPFAFGTFAYIISRRGMELMLDKYMNDRTRRSILISPRPDPADLWFDWLPDVYLPVPALFMTWGQQTTVHTGTDDGVHASTISLSNTKMFTSSIDLYSESVSFQAQLLLKSTSGP